MAFLARRRSNRRSARKGNQRSRTPGLNTCTDSDRVQFVFNLLALFKSDFSRIREESASSLEPANRRKMHRNIQRGRGGERRVINWKFLQLDMNKDKVLRKKELRDLKRMVKKVVQPRVCAKAFARTLDANQDDIINRREWLNYMRIGSNNDFTSKGNFEQANNPRPINFDEVNDRKPSNANRGGANAGHHSNRNNRPDLSHANSEDNEEQGSKFFLLV